MLRDFIKPIRKATLSLPGHTERFDEGGMSRDALAALQGARASRRSFIKGGGVMIVGFHMGGKLDAQSSVNPAGTVDATQVDSWVALAADGSVTAYSGKIEFGQGFSTVQTQMVAEELDVSISRVRVVMG